MAARAITEADIEAGSELFTLDDGVNSTRATALHRINVGRNWEARYLGVAVSAGNGPCPAAIVVDARGSGGEMVKRGTLRGSPLSATLGALAWSGRVPIKKDGVVFFLVRNDTGETVTVGYVWSGILLEGR